MLAVQDLYQEFMATYDQKNWSAVVNTGEHILSTKPTVECAPRERALILAYLATAYRTWANWEKLSRLSRKPGVKLPGGAGRKRMPLWKA